MAKYTKWDKMLLIGVGIISLVVILFIIFNLSFKKADNKIPEPSIVHCGNVMYYESGSGTPGKQCTDRKGLHIEVNQCDGDNIKPADFTCNEKDLCEVFFYTNSCLAIGKNIDPGKKYTCKTSSTGAKYCGEI